jgi:hypothetical protein
LALFALACCRNIWPALTEKSSKKAIKLAERALELNQIAADSTMMEEAIDKAMETVDVEGGVTREKAAAAAAAAASGAVLMAAGQTEGWRSPYDMAIAVAASAECATNDHSKQRTIQAELIRDIFGNPFRPVTFDTNWRTSTAVALAQQMYDTRDFSTMPILADALQEVGCDNADILDHCRGTGPHVRGCWVVDQVLGKF